MPAFANKSTIAPSSGAQQSAQWCDIVVAALLSAGGTRILNLSQHNSGFKRETVIRLPPLDPYSSHSEVIFVNNAGGTAAGQLGGIWDTKLFGQASQTAASIQGAQGVWTGGAGIFPAAGSPTTSTLLGNSSFSNTFEINFGAGAQTWTIRTIISEYCIAVCSDNGTNQNLMVIARAADTIRGGRDIGIQAQQGALLTHGATLTFGAPSGAEHLSIEVEGVTFNVTFPTSALTSFQLARELTRQLGGFGEAFVRNLYPQVQGETVRVRIPPDRGPAGNYSTTRPRVRLLYQDPSVVTAGIDFSLVSATTMTAVITGAGGIVRLSTKNWPVIGARIGTVVYNRTRGSSANATGFTTTTNPMDTIVLDTVPGSWLAGDSYDVLPCQEHPDGAGAFTGVNQAVLQSSPFTAVTPGGSVTVVLNDLYGEAQGHYQVGQEVFFVNNGMAAILGTAGATAGMKVGSLITNNTRGSTGILRAVDTVANNMLVDTLTGASLAGTPYNEDPWASGDSVTANGVTVILNATSDSGTHGPATVGWMGFAPVTAVGQVSATDPRTTLTLNLAALNVNPSLVLFPSFSIGPHARLQLWNIALNMPTPVFSATLSLPTLETPTVTSTTDVQRNETTGMTHAPAHVPDFETYSYQLGEIVGGWASAAAFGSDLVWGHVMHVRSINAANVLPAIGDNLQESQDPNRIWVPVGQFQSGSFGAGTTPNPDHWACLGPGAVP